MSSTVKGIIWVASFIAVFAGIAFLSDTFVLDRPDNPGGHRTNMIAGLTLLIGGGLVFIYFITKGGKSKQQG